MIRRISSRLRAGGAALLIASSCAPAPAPPAREPAIFEPPRAVAPLPPAETCRRIVKIEVSKGERRLHALCENGAQLELPIALGRESEGHKRIAGDWRTPEGHYRIIGPPQTSRFHLFIPIDYPSAEDAETAFPEGRLSRADYGRIVDALERGESPPGDTALGGDLGFHGEGERWRGDSTHLDWTYGCVALSDADMEFLAERAEVGTPVEIRR